MKITISQYLHLPLQNVNDLTPEQHSHEIGNAIDQLTNLNGQAFSQLDLAHAEIARLEAELAKASNLQQTVTIARQTIHDLATALEQRKTDYDREREAHWQTPEGVRTQAEQIDHLTTALRKIADADYRGNRSAEQGIAYTALTTAGIKP